MVCENCGTLLDVNDLFCPKCGKKRSLNVKNFEDFIEYQIKPKFILEYETLKSLLIIAFLIFIIYFLFENYLYIRIRNFSFLTLVFLLFCIVIIFTVIRLIIIDKEYKSSKYVFYKTRVEYKNGFLNKEIKKIKYKNIREIAMNQNILERLFNIGTITIFTNASTYKVNSRDYQRNRHNRILGKNGIYIRSVYNVNKKYQIVKSIIDSNGNN